MTSEEEYIAACHTSQHTKWLRQLLSEMSIFSDSPTTLHVDNQGALKMALANGPTKLSKYVDIKYHYLREVIANKSIRLEYIPSRDMLADPFTKALQKPMFVAMMPRLNLCAASPQ